MYLRWHGKFTSLLQTTSRGKHTGDTQSLSGTAPEEQNTIEIEKKTII